MKKRNIIFLLSLLLTIPLGIYVLSISNYKKASSSPSISPAITPGHKSGADLSYLMFIVDKELSIQVTDSQGNAVGESFIQQGIGDPVSGKTSPSFREFLLPKPESGKYKVIFSSSESRTYNLESYLYDRGGNPKATKFSRSIEKGKNEIFEVLFDKENSKNSTIEIKL